MQVDHALVDPHLELVPGLGTLTWGRGDFMEQASLNSWRISGLSFGQESRIKSRIMGLALIFNHHRMDGKTR